MCAIRDCAVCECDPDEIPACWREEDSSAASGRDAAAAAKGGKKGAKKAAAGAGGGGGVPAWAQGALGGGASSGSGSASAGGGWDAAAAGFDAPPHGGGGGAPPSAGEELRGVEATDPARIAQLSRVNFLGPAEQSGLLGWSEPRGLAADNVWTEDPGCGGDDESPDVKYVNLLANPEGYTGYTGPSARRIWQSIYDENCFPVTGGPDVGGMCYEQRVFFRMISGLQTSINTHIAMTYGDGRGSDSDMFKQQQQQLQEQAAAAAAKAGRGTVGAAALGAAPGGLRSTLLHYLSRASAIVSGHPERSASRQQVTGRSDPAELILHPGLQPSIDMYIARIGRFPDRMRNLYFTFLFVLRAVAVARPQLLAMDYRTGDAAEDAATSELVRRLIDVEAPAVLRGFDESVMFKVRPEDVAAAASARAQARTYADLEAAGRAAGSAGSCGAGGAGAPLAPGLGDPSELRDAAADLEALTAQKVALRSTFRDKYRNISRIMGESHPVYCTTNRER